MAKVLGIGGVFVKTEDRDGLAAWYKDVLGFSIADWCGAVFPHPAIGYGAWGVFPADTGYFDPSPHAVMINLIVDDLDGVLQRAADAGVSPLGRDDKDANGRFAWLLDPMGVKIELWQPKPV